MKYLILVLALGLTACSGPSLVAEKENVWVVGERNTLGFREPVMYYCQAFNEHKDKVAGPICIEAETIKLKPEFRR